MKCYKHHDAEAVGICKSCSKGVCIECAVDMGKGLACKNSCEEEVKNLIELIESNKGASKRTSSAFYRNSFIYGAIGAVMLYYGMFVEKGIAIFLVPAGLVFLVGMGLSISSAIKYKNNN